MEKLLVGGTVLKVEDGQTLGFMKKFNFRKNGALMVGVERECFIASEQGKIVPRAVDVLIHLPDRKRFGYELSACQLEDRVGPVCINQVKEALLANEYDIAEVERRLNLKRLHVEVAPEDMPLDVYPDPSGRYQKITKNMPKCILSAACRVTGTHIHIGMPDHETALRVYNSVIEHTKMLCDLGNGSSGKRLMIYKIMAPDSESPSYDSWSDFYEKAVMKGFENDPRRCWNLIRLSVHGTIEFRMFGSTPDLNKVVRWAEICHKLCREAIAT